MIAENVARDIRVRGFQAERDHAIVTARGVQDAPQLGTEPIGDRPVVGVVVGEVAAEPGAACLPGERAGHRAIERRGDIPLVRASVAAASGRVDHKGLVRLSPDVVAPAGDAPRGENLVLVTGPRPRRADPGAGPRQPLGPAGGFPLIAAILLAEAVRVPPAKREAAA